jgi:hypothetical protein
MNKMIRNVAVLIAMAAATTMAYAEPKVGAKGSHDAETGMSANGVTDAGAQGSGSGVAVGVGIAAAVAVGVGIAIGASNNDDNTPATSTATR